MMPQQPNNNNARAAAAEVVLPPPTESTITIDPRPLIPGGKAIYDPVVLSDETDQEWPLPTPKTKLGRTRLLATELTHLQQPPSLFFGGGNNDQELYYAQFLLGTWNVTATLKRKIFPYGPNFLPSNTLLEGSPRNRYEKVGNACTYQVRYIDVEEKGSSKQPKIIQDRAFNAKSISQAYKQLVQVQDVDWDYRTNPTKLSLSYGPGPLSDDMRPLGPRRTEIFITARAYDDDEGEDSSSSSQYHYSTAESNRIVNLGAGTAVVSDTETITEFTKLSSDDDRVIATSRIAVFLTPNPNSREGVMWSQVNGKAVAFYDYELDMHLN